MNYYISRSGQQYGPYSLADLQRYVQQGNISLNDMARSDGMTDWVPVSQVMGNISTPPATPTPAPAAPTPYSAPQTPYNTPATPYGSTPASNPYGAPATPSPSGSTAPAGYTPPSNPYGAPATPGTYNPPSNPYGGQVVPYGGQGAYGAPQQAGVYPSPPSLHWAMVLLISFLCGIFQLVWLFVELSWVKKVRPQSNAMTLHISAIAAMFGGIFLGAVVAAIGGNNSEAMSGVGAIIMVVGFLAGAVMIIMGNFAMRAAIQDFYNKEEPIGLHLSPIMTFFFSIFYFQYHFTRINEMKQQAAMQQRAAAGGQYYGQ